MKRIQINAWIDATALVGLMTLASTGLVLRYQLPPGSGGIHGHGQGRGAAGRSVELLWGLTRHEWGDVHYWIAVGLLAVLSLHALLHWKWILSVVRGHPGGASGMRLAVGAAALGLLVLAVLLPMLSETESLSRQALQEQRTETDGNQTIEREGQRP